MDKRVVDVSTAAALMHEDTTKGMRPALLFGPERTGLENEDLVHADVLITIPTDSANTSLNIAQAAVIVCYEWCRRRDDLVGIARSAQRGELADKTEIEGFFRQLEGYLDEVNHFRTEDKKIVMWQNLRTIFTRAELSGQEVKTLRGMIRALFTRRIEP
jgi:tRNA C32,U32 (ribose-2'-O)-methylase TrmJ